MSILVGAVVPVDENSDFDSDSNSLNFDSEVMPRTPISIRKVARKSTTASLPTGITGFT